MSFTRIPQPAFALQAFDSTETPNEKGEYKYRVPGFLYDMHQESNVLMKTEFHNALSEVTNYIRGSKIKMLKSLVINCHGNKGCLFIGKGVNRDNVYLFSQLKGLVKRIYLPCCNVAGGGEGINFCLAIAHFPGAVVFAPEETQYRYLDEKPPQNKIDFFEGSVFKFKPNGHYRRSIRLSNYDYDEENQIRL